MQKAPSPDETTTKPDLGFVAIASVTILTIQAMAFALIYLSFDQWAERGQFGDMFGVVNSLFSGLAFAGIIYTVHLQRKELGLQRQELSLTRAELSRSATAQEKSEQAQKRQNEIGDLQLKHLQRRAAPVFLGSTISTHLMWYEMRNVFNVRVRNDGGIAYGVRVYVEECTSGLDSRHAALFLPAGRENLTLEPGEVLEGTLFGPERTDEQKKSIWSTNEIDTRARFEAKDRSIWVQVVEHIDLRVAIDYVDFQLAQQRQRFFLNNGYLPAPAVYGVTPESAIPLSLVYRDTIPIKPGDQEPFTYEGP